MHAPVCCAAITDIVRVCAWVIVPGRGYADACLGDRNGEIIDQLCIQPAQINSLARVIAAVQGNHPCMFGNQRNAVGFIETMAGDMQPAVFCRFAAAKAVVTKICAGDSRSDCIGFGFDTATVRRDDGDLCCGHGQREYLVIDAFLFSGREVCIAGIRIHRRSQYYI